LKQPVRKSVNIQQNVVIPGPLPNPETLQKYNHILPGAADRILKMAENQQAHRHRIETIVINSRERKGLLGQVFGFFVALTAIIGGTYLLAIGKSAEGFTTMLLAVGSIVSLFLFGRKAQAKERIAKSQQIT
jgi:uncharacterized membrane protein